MDASERLSGDSKQNLPIKVLSSQLRESNDSIGPGGKIERSIKRMGHGKSTPLMVSVVWMQGTVLKIQSNGNAVLLLDETGTFVVNGVDNIPKGKPCLFPGKYVMVMGMIHSHFPEPVLRAVKVADLSKSAIVHRRMWKSEVEDLQQTLP